MTRPVRRGLPRVPGGEPWPPAGAAAAIEPDVLPDADPSAPAASDSDSDSASLASPAAAAPVPSAAPAAGTARDLRRGLPRVPGGEPWPPVSSASAPALAPDDVAIAASAPEPARPAADSAPVAAAPSATEDAGGGIRRGLPREPGGEAWPPAGAAGPTPADVSAPEVAAVAVPAPAPAAAALVPAGPREPLPFRRTVWAGAAASGPRGRTPEPRRYGPFTRAQWIGAVVVGGGGLLFAAGMAVALTRWFLSLEFMGEFLAAFPGEYHLPDGAPVGLPAWLGWQHFLNSFFLLLIIRTGLQVRREKRPSVFWSPRGNKKRKISLALWFHQSLDILWLVNGVVFVALLFVTGQWMRIVPTSWEVLPNALSAALQYVSLDWPTENGWVNYNALQQLAYFTTVFVAAPLAAITGVRMSGVWPKDAPRLNRLYPVEWARAVHFPVMLYFVVFIAIHVFLVFATGALRNLNHMYAAQGSTDPTAYADNWAGFWWFFASLVVMAAAWIAARPLVLSPIARLFGTVKGR